MPLPASVSYPHIEEPEGQPARLKRLPRVRVAQIIMDQIAHGWGAEEICRHYPHLRPAEVHAAFAYYFDNKEAVDGEIESEWQAIQELSKTPHTSPLYARLKREGRV